MTQPAPMRQFCAQASLLPTRRDLIEGGIDFRQRNDLAPVFLRQAGTVPARDSGQVASPSMSGIITVLKDELDRAFIGDQSTATTVSKLSSGIAAATRS